MTAAELGPAATPERLEHLARQQARYLAARRAVLVFLVLVALGVVVSLTYVTVQTRATAAQVQACTTPGNACYETLRAQSEVGRQNLVRQVKDAITDGTTTSRQNQAALARIEQALQGAGCLPVPNR